MGSSNVVEFAFGLGDDEIGGFEFKNDEGENGCGEAEAGILIVSGDESSGGNSDEREEDRGEDKDAAFTDAGVMF